LPQLEWKGRLTVVAAVTNAIDRFSAHADALGPRWMYIRIPDRHIRSRRNAARAARQAGVRESRTKAVAMATDIIERARNKVIDVAVRQQRPTRPRFPPLGAVRRRRTPSQEGNRRHAALARKVGHPHTSTPQIRASEGFAYIGLPHFVPKPIDQEPNQT
jgi:hypothetical protein